MNKKLVKRKLLTLALAGTMLCGSVSMKANAASVEQTMDWAAPGVTVTTQTEDIGVNYVTLFVYNKKIGKDGRTCIKSKAKSDTKSAWVEISNRKTKSARGVHYVKYLGSTYAYRKYDRDIKKGYKYYVYY